MTVSTPTGLAAVCTSPIGLGALVEMVVSTPTGLAALHTSPTGLDVSTVGCLFTHSDIELCAIGLPTLSQLVCTSPSEAGKYALSELPSMSPHTLPSEVTSCELPHAPLVVAPSREAGEHTSIELLSSSTYESTWSELPRQKPSATHPSMLTVKSSRTALSREPLNRALPSCMLPSCVPTRCKLLS